jgi:polygalacturonase
VPKPAPLPRLLSHPHLQSALKSVGLASSDPPCPHPCFDLLDYGAVVDGSVLATNLIIKALEDVKAQGGGSIYFPAGIILTGA